MSEITSIKVGDLVCLRSDALENNNSGRIDMNRFLEINPFIIGKVIAKKYSSSCLVQFPGFYEGHSGDMGDNVADKWWISTNCLKKIGSSKRMGK